MDHHGLHHIHRRKRLYQNLEPYPHHKKWINLYDKFLLIFALFAPLVTVAQIYKIVVEKNAAGVSLIAWLLYTAFAVPWLVYGLIHKAKPIIVSYTLIFILNAAVVFATLVYA